MSEDYTFETRTDPWLPTSDGVTRLTNGGLLNQRTGEHIVSATDDTRDWPYFSPCHDDLVTLADAGATIGKCRTCHKAIIDLSAELQELYLRRAVHIRDARTAGVPASRIASQWGITRQRVEQIMEHPGHTANFELRLDDGSVVKAQGTSGADAARNYTNRHPDATVIAWRHYPQHGVFNAHPSQVVG